MALLLLTLALAGSLAASASARDKDRTRVFLPATESFVVVPIPPPVTATKAASPANEPGDGGGGFYGCWTLYATHDAGAPAGTGHWWHHFNPSWCGNGFAITYANPSWHWLDTSGLFGNDGVRLFQTGGCVGCGSISYDAKAYYSYNFLGWTSHGQDDIYATLLPWGAVY